MAVTTFAAIDIGSYNVSMEIFEITKKNGLRTIDRVRKRLELGKDTFNLKKISTERLQELTHILSEYKQMMEGYKVSDYRACAKSALREARNCLLVQEYVFQKTGIRIDVLSNSEQRLLGYKSIASRGTEFQKIIEKGTAIVDVGGGSVQISLFDKDSLVTTQNLLLGSLRIRERLSGLENENTHYDELVEQLINNDINNFKRMYLKDRKIENIILVGDYFTNLIFQNKSDRNKIETKEEFMQWYQHILSRSPRELTQEMGIGAEMASVVIPTAVLYRRLLEELGAETIWLPGIQLTDGIAFDFGDRKKIIRSQHNFEEDILMAAKNIAKRYAGNKNHTEAMIAIGDQIFDAVKKGNGLGSREKLLLRVATYLHDCGKYISLVNVAECSYSIIMSTEIIGLSDKEREIIANVVRYNTRPFVYYNENGTSNTLSREDYMTVARLSAVLRLCSCLDAGCRQKATGVEAVRKDAELIITVRTDEDFTLESGLFREQVAFFEEVMGLHTSLKLKRKEGRG